ncbi:hypothetical protein O6H91_14G029200 [Diphasiastrum complanatum]|nr:hypothetical protein O6H91_14G029200 [Diphasiastrum complanatum]
MHYIAVSPQRDRNDHAATVTTILKDSTGYIRLQVERQGVEESEEDRAAHEKFDQEYVQGWWESTRSLIARQWKITGRLRILILLRCLQVIILGFFGGTIFYHLGGRIDSLKMNSVRGMGFVSSMTVLLINLVQQPLHMLQRPVFYKQRAQRFYRVSSYLVAEAVVSLPQSLIEAFLYTMGAYFLASLSRAGHWEHYFQYLLVLFLVAYLGSAMVRFTSSVAPILEAANALAGVLVAIFLLFSGFVIYPHNVPPYWKWMLYANPLHWAIVIYGLIQLGENYKEPCSDYTQLLQYCHVYPRMTVGNAFLKFYGLKTERHLVWVGYAIIIAWILVFKLLSYLALEKFQHIEVNPSLPRQKKRAHVYSNLDEDNEASDIFSEQLIVNAGKLNVASHKNDKRMQNDHEVLHDEEASHPVRTGQLAPGPGIPKLTPFAVSFLRRQQEASPQENFHPDNGKSISSYIPAIKPITLSFRNIGLIVKDRKSKKEQSLLRGVSGYARPGTMVALVGSSSSGATPLLRCLAGRVSHGTVEGEIFVNGAKLSTNIFSRISGYAESLDAHQPYLTVRESLAFSASLRLGATASRRQKIFLVDLILELMGLSEVSNLLVGDLSYSTGRTYELSKKLTIAVELAANPSILFLDNPTSNLDSVGARNVMYAIKAVAGTGRTVISTIRHPSARMLSAFNKVLILNNGGEQVYFGPVGWNSSKLVAYFVSIPKVPKYDEKQNPITYVLDILGAGIRKRRSVQNYGEIYLESQLGKKNEAEINKLCAGGDAGDGVVVSEDSGYAASYCTQAAMVFLRTQRFLYRNVHYTFGRLAGAIALGLLLGSVYIQIHWSSSISMTSRSLFIYIQVLLIGVMNANNVIPQLGSDRLAYFREKRASMYAPIFYPISWAVSEIPYLILITLVFVAIGNGMAGIGTDTPGHFFEYWFGLFLFTLTVTYFGIFLTIATPAPMLAAFAMSICLSIWITGSGVVVPKLRIHFYAWLYWSNPFQYAINALTSISFYCNTKSPVCLACPAGKPCPACPCKQLTDVGYTFVWDRLKHLRSLNHQRISLDFVALGGMSTVLALLCVICFVFFKHNSKPSS